VIVVSATRAIRSTAACRSLSEIRVKPPPITMSLIAFGLGRYATATDVFRPDEVRPSFDRAAILANAPHADGEFYLVPAVLGE